MPIEFENSQQGATDISGTPDPVRTSHQAKGDANKRQNQNERRPGKGSQQQKNPLQGIGDALGGLGKDVQGAEQGASDWLGHGAQTAGKAALDWGEEWNRAPEQVLGFARQAYAQLSGGYHDSVHNIYQGDDARARLAQFGTDAAAELFVPGIAQEEKAKNEYATALALSGQITQSQRQQQAKTTQEQAVQDAPGMALQDVTLPITGPEGVLAQAAVPLGEAALGGNQGDINASLAWAGVGSLMAFGHLPPEIRKMLRDRFGDWPVLEKLLGDAKTGLTNGNRAAMDPQKQDQAVIDHIKQQLDEGGAIETSSRSVRKGVTPDEGKRVEAEVGPTGEIKLLTSEATKRREKILKQLGVEDIEELPARAVELGGFSGKQMKLIRDGWKTLAMPYDLKAYTYGERPLSDPRIPIEAITDAETKDAATAHATALNHLLGEVKSGLWATSRNPADMIMRALAGQSRSLVVTHREWMYTMAAALEKWGVSDANGKLLTQAAEGSQEAYDQLPPEAKTVADSWGLLRSAMRQQAEGTAYSKDFVSNYAPRLDVVTEAKRPGPGRPNRAAVLAKEAKKHRALAINLGPGGQLVQGQRFGTVAEANDAIRAAREDLASHLLDTEKPLRKKLIADPEANAIRALAKTDPVAAAERARQMATDRFNLKDENFFRNVGRAAGYQARSILTAKALRELEQTHVKTESGITRPAAVAIQDSRHLDQLRNEGYVAIDDARFRTHMFEKGIASTINRYMRQSAEMGGLLEAAATANRQMQRVIMFSPTIHGANMAARAGALSIVHPLEVASHLSKGRALNPAQLDEESFALRQEAYQSGLLPPREAGNYMQNFSDQIDAAFGDSGADVHLGEPTKQGRMLQALSAPVHAYQGLEDGFWRQINDFGVTAYHVEKNAAMARGFDEATARALAARRANSWMGMVLPEDTSPLWQRISKLGFFAPNWWRTWAELTLPIYRRSGIWQDPRMARYVATQGAKHIAAAYAFQHTTGNLLNMMMSGHLQSQNQRGNQDKVEITNPAILHTLDRTGLLPQGIDPNTGVNPTTGAVMTMENPFGRQVYSLEQALGEQSGQPGTRVGPGIKAGPADLQFSLPGQASDVSDGLSRALAGKVSPIADASAALMNIDLYRLLGYHTLQGVVPGQQPGQASPLSAVAAVLMELPGGMQFMQQAQRNIDQGGKDQSSLFGTQVPTSVADTVNQIPSWGARAVFTGLLGTNPPYPSAEKTRGTLLSDADYQKVKELQATYEKQRKVADAEMLSGQVRPDKWRTQYLDASQKHGSQMQALFHNAPEYVNGADGMLSQWEALYDQATNPDGTVDQGKLALLQAKFRSEHTSDQMSGLQTSLRKNDAKYPGVALYHKVLDRYDQWQATYAAQHGVDVTTLRQDISGYNALYGDSASQQKYLQQHKELRAYDQAVKSQWDRSLDGMMYQFFHGQHVALQRTLKARGMTMQGLEAEVAQEPEAAA